MVTGSLSGSISTAKSVRALSELKASHTCGRVPSEGRFIQLAAVRDCTWLMPVSCLQEPKGLYVLNDIFRYTDDEASAAAREAQEQGVEVVEEAGTHGMPDGPGSPQGQPSVTVPVRHVAMDAGPQQHQVQQEKLQQYQQGRGILGSGAGGPGVGAADAYREGDRAAGSGGVAFSDVPTHGPPTQQQQQQARGMQALGEKNGGAPEAVVGEPPFSQQRPLLSPLPAAHPAAMPGAFSYASVTVTGTPSLTVTGHAIGPVHGPIPGRPGQPVAALGVLQPGGTPSLLGQPVSQPLNSFNALGAPSEPIRATEVQYPPGSGRVAGLAPGQPGAGTAAAAVGALGQLGGAPGLPGGGFTAAKSIGPTPAGAGVPTLGVASMGPAQAANAESLPTDGPREMESVDTAEAQGTPEVDSWPLPVSLGALGWAAHPGDVQAGYAQKPALGQVA